MSAIYFMKGAILGFAIAAPVGPIGILCIRRTLEYGRFSGLFSGLGAAVADTIYGIVAAFGLTLLSNYLILGEFWLRLIGGAFLVYLGVTTFYAKIHKRSEKVTHKTLLNDFISTLILTLTNPMTIFSYIAIFAGLGLASTVGDYRDASWLVFGVFIGSSLWWLVLSEIVTLFRKSVGPRSMKWINRIAGLAIAVFGIVAWASLAFR